MVGFSVYLWIFGSLRFCVSDTLFHSYFPITQRRHTLEIYSVARLFLALQVMTVIAATAKGEEESLLTVVEWVVQEGEAGKESAVQQFDENIRIKEWYE